MILLSYKIDKKMICIFSIILQLINKLRYNNLNLFYLLDYNYLVSNYLAYIYILHFYE